MTSYHLCQAWLPCIAIILINLYQLLIYLSLVSANTSFSTYVSTSFSISANTSFSTIGVKNGWHNQTQENFTWSTSILDSTGSTLHCTGPTLYSTGSILHITVWVQFGLKDKQSLFFSKSETGIQKTFRSFFYTCILCILQWLNWRRYSAFYNG